VFQEFALSCYDPEELMLGWSARVPSRFIGKCRAVLRAAPLAFGLALVLAVAPALTTNCGAPADLHDGWMVSAPEKQGLDAALICGIGGRFEGGNNADAHGVVVVRHGALVYERYFSGPDRRWPEQHWREPLVATPHDARTEHDLQSITKSIVGILVGIALRAWQLSVPGLPW
jgi:hypothetical protein